MPAGADDTRARLIRAATREFAQHGIHAASLLEVTRAAGQRNRGAVHYHFGSRTGVLAAVIEQYVDFLAEREAELLAVAEAGPADDLHAVVAAFVRPALELAELDETGRWYLMVLAELSEDEETSLDPDVRDALERAGGYRAFALLGDRMPPMSEELRSERMYLTTIFILRAIATRGRAVERAHPRQQLPAETFAANLEALAVSMLRAPLP